MNDSNEKLSGHSDRHLQIVPDFFEEATALRAVYDKRMDQLFKISSQRFVWDYWHVPGQYTYFRTPARNFFPNVLFKAFLNRLKAWGLQNLGCDSVTMPWLSYYVNGSRQELHVDTPNGPWSFVFSLTNWECRKFTGGETILLTPACLNYWKVHSNIDSFGVHSIVQSIPTPFNQLSLFDSRIPHGVKQVEGTHDPLEGRVVLHGWFQEPKIRLIGNRQLSEVKQVLNRHWTTLVENLAPIPLFGTIVMRISILPDGQTSLKAVLTNNLVSSTGNEQSNRQAQERIKQWITSLKFSTTSDHATLTLPLKFPLKADFS